MAHTLHKPVLLDEVLDYLKPAEGEIYLDCTYGRGGYSRAILQAADCKVVGTDRDTDAIEYGQKMVTEFSGRFACYQSRFSELTTTLARSDLGHVDGIVADLGVSSPQLDDAEKGFSFMRDGPLDMQMGGDQLRATDVVNNCEEEDLANILWTFGEERFSRRIAKAIVTARQNAAIQTTLGLAEIVTAAVPVYEKRIHPATRTFQALRIYVNQELEEIASLLTQSLKLLKPMGRLVIVAFHSLEDRLVKNFFSENSTKNQHYNKYKMSEVVVETPLEILTRKPITPSAEEVRTNPRSRSAKLRAAARTSWPVALMGILSLPSWEKITHACRYL